MNKIGKYDNYTFGDEQEKRYLKIATHGIASMVTYDGCEKLEFDT